MITTIRDRSRQVNIVTLLIAIAVLSLAFLFGRQASPFWLGILVASLGGVVLLTRPVLGLPALVVASLVVRLEFNTGTVVRLNPATLLIPALLVVWLLDSARHRDLHFVSSRANRSLLLFLLAGLLSLLIGRATWDPLIPVRDNFLLVQLAQWAIFAFSASAFWLTANLVRDAKWLRRLTFTFLLLAGSLAMASVLPITAGVASRFATLALIRAPFWMLLAALAGGQLFFNQRLSSGWRLFLIAVLLATLYFAFFRFRFSSSTWVGVGTAVGILAWLRFPRMRWVVVLLVVGAIAAGILIPGLWNFAGGDYEWTASGGSRLALIERVITVTMRNPITGLGPAAYRPYANATPLVYLHIFWVNPLVNSHNNYVDLFSHVGLLGLALLGWFVAEVARLGYRLHCRYGTGFRAGYVNSMLAVGAGSLAIMTLADWILPFVYNIGFEGFQASVLVWLFLGGLVALENMPQAVISDP